MHADSAVHTTAQGTMDMVTQDLGHEPIGLTLLWQLGRLEGYVDSNMRESGLKQLQELRVLVDTLIPKRTLGAGNASAKEKVKALRQAWECASKGTWNADAVRGLVYAKSGTAETQGQTAIMQGCGDLIQANNDAAFTALAHEAMPYLLRCVALVEYMLGQQEISEADVQNPFFIDAATQVLTNLRKA